MESIDDFQQLISINFCRHPSEPLVVGAESHEQDGIPVSGMVFKRLEL